MANAAKLRGVNPVRMFLCGYPGSGKTGSLAALANAGYKLRVLDFDGNADPLLHFVDDRALPNVDIVTLEDELRSADKYVEPVGIPQAFNTALKMMKHWKYTDADGEEVDLGRSADWGSDTVVVLDSLSSMGDAAFYRAMKCANRNPHNMTRQLWGSAMADQDGFVRILRSANSRYHLVVLAHLKLVGPEDIEQNDDDLTKDLKEKVADVVPTKLFPWALGSKLSPRIGGRVPTLVMAEQKGGARARRILSTAPRDDIDLKVPAKVAGELPIEDGLLTIFEALGHKAPGFEGK